MQAASSTPRGSDTARHLSEVRRVQHLLCTRTEKEEGETQQEGEKLLCRVFRQHHDDQPFLSMTPPHPCSSTAAVSFSTGTLCSIYSGFPPSPPSLRPPPSPLPENLSKSPFAPSSRWSHALRVAPPPPRDILRIIYARRKIIYRLYLEYV